ncbi:MAG: peptidoglycan glycosyltransferase, partial [Oscillospiraceae bacterium]|nr:peptidoglycan glycosyltransferase [Oscillospiraceae bacterium]
MPERPGRRTGGISRLRASRNQTWKRGRRAAGAKPSVSMKKRANAVILSALFVAAAALSVNLFKIMIVDHDKYIERANSRQFDSITLPAARGSIYDANGTVLAQSATVYRIFVDPGLFRREIAAIEERNAKLTTEAEGKVGEDGQPVVPDLVNTEELRRDLTAFLAEQLEIPEEKVSEALDKQDSRFVVLKPKVEKSRADRIMDYVSHIQKTGSARKVALESISRQSDTKRYYPQNELAASVIGFMNNDGKGFYGIEAYYDSNLSGIDGKTVTAVDANGNEMPYRYSKTYPAQDGDDVYVTIDMTLQTYLENAITDMVDTFQVGNRACGIILDAKTGAVRAMASVRGFDPNDPYTIYDQLTQSQIMLLPEGDERDKAVAAARETQWRNKCVTETYIPGSVFKVFTASSGLEENVITYQDRFYCDGEYPVKGAAKPFHCWKRRGHGSEYFEEILTNSCNPAFISIGQTLGRTMFCQYFRSFGLEERTGIDLPYETKSISNLDSMGPVDLAASSYGQRNSLTPIEMVTGYAAVVNGGYLLEPYVVSKVVDQAGNVVLSHDKTVRRQVISEETSAEMRRALQFVVDGNHGGNAYIKGYKIGGKSGTSQKLQGMISAADAEYVASYCCFAPADDPEIVLLIMADEPNKNITYYGATVVVAYSRRV